MRTIFSLSLFLLVGCSPQFWGATVIRPHELTDLRLHVTKERIEKYQRLNGSMPQQLSDTSPIPGKSDDDDFKDGWGNPLRFEPLDDDRCTLASLGADGAPGGQGENRDIIRTVKIVSPDDEDEPSIVAD